MNRADFVRRAGLAGVGVIVGVVGAVLGGRLKSSNPTEEGEEALRTRYFFANKHVYGPYMITSPLGDLESAVLTYTLQEQTFEEFRNNTPLRPDVIALIDLRNITGIDEKRPFTNEVARYMIREGTAANLGVYTTKEIDEQIERDYTLQRALASHIAPQVKRTIVPLEKLRGTVQGLLPPLERKEELRYTVPEIK